MPMGLRKSAIPFLIIMALPAIYGIVRYFILNGYSILLAFSDGEPFHDPFTIRNFRMFWNDMQGNGVLLIALKNTLKYFTVGLVQQFICYLAAYFIYKKIPGYKTFRFVYYLPCLIPGVVTSAIFMELIRVGGPIYKIANSLFGIEYNALLSRPETATKTMIIFLFLSGIGSTYLIYVGAMNRIPVEVLESARIDGCNGWREFWSLVFPLTFGTYATFFLTLSAVVDYVDGTATELPAGVTEADVEIVREARNMMVELVCREWVITKDAENKEDIKDFLAYLTSDKAQMLAAKHCNGLPVLNYGYVPTEEDMGFALSEFSESIQKLSQRFHYLLW